MKKLFASALALSLILAACGNDDSKKDENNKEKDKTSQESKTSKDENKDKTKDSAAKDDKASSSSDSNSSDHASSSDSSNNNSSDNGTSSGATSSHAASGNSSNAQNNQQASVNKGNNVAQGNQGAGTTQTGYVAPYQSANAVPAASTIAKVPANRQDALKHLPNFPQSLATAQNEANRLNGQQNAYNDYGIEDLGNGTYAYIFSFHNQANPGTYTLVTVNQQGQASIIDPAYNGHQ